MTRQRNDDKGTEFGSWIRTKHQDLIGSHRFSAQNLDYIWHDYRANWFILIEEKRYGGMRNSGAGAAQKDTHGILCQMLQRANGVVVNTLRGLRKAEYRGYYEVIFSATSPEDSDWIRINGQLVNEQGLLNLLLTGGLEQVPVLRQATFARKIFHGPRVEFGNSPRNE